MREVGYDEVNLSGVERGGVRADGLDRVGSSWVRWDWVGRVRVDWMRWGGSGLGVCGACEVGYGWPVRSARLCHSGRRHALRNHIAIT